MSNDLIRREDAIETAYQLRRKPNDEEWDWWLRSFNAIPSADRPQGEWIDAEIPLECGGSMPIQVCNLCKTFYPLAYTGGGHRFCPNCGAKMKGADDE